MRLRPRTGILRNGRHTFRLFADFHQIYVEGDGVHADVSALWTTEAIRNGAIWAPGHIRISTGSNRFVELTLIVATDRPALDRNAWQRIINTSLTTDKSTLVGPGNSDFYPDAARLEITPGSYAALLASRDLGTDAEQHELYLWPGDDPADVDVLKHARAPT